MDDQTEDIARLSDCLAGLSEILALPGLWSGGRLPQVVASLLDVLSTTLRLDFAYAQVNLASEPEPLEVIRPAPSDSTVASISIRRHLEQCLSFEKASAVLIVPNPLGPGELNTVQICLGPERKLGFVVVGANRKDFPTAAERTLLQVAVNQALLEVQNAQMIAAEKRAEGIERLNSELEAENSYLRMERDADGHWDEIVGQSEPLREILRLVDRVASTGACVLIQGETGTGKEVIARALHRRSNRSALPFVKLNCAAIPTGLLESDLFGHERGAFTGAIARKAGRFELADRGTLFLDEVGEIPLELQAKLLRVLQEREFERLGSTRTIRVDVRVVAASNRDLAQMVAEGTFRRDLYYRLKVFPIHVPPLRQRRDDIPLLVRCFTERHARRCNKSVTEIPPETMKSLCEYSWPGNIRELENFIERSVILSQGHVLEVPLGELKAEETGPLALGTLEGVEREHILRALERSRWVIAGAQGAAAKLGMKRTSLQSKMLKLGISRPRP
jgi:formate hydrogenlyase transcriptional activator